MTFISLVAALLLEQLRPLRTGNRLYAAYLRYTNKVSHTFNAGHQRDGTVAWVVAVVPVVVIAFAVYWLLRHSSWLLALLWNIAILYVAFGFRQFSHFYTDVMLALRTDNLSHARDVLTVWRGESAQQFSASECARVAIELGLMRSHRHVFGVMMWFVVLGPAGAILYRLAAMLNERWGSTANGEGEGFGHFTRMAFNIIDWVPVRLTALGFAVAGDFTGAVECWREQAPAWRSHSQGIILASAAGALGVKLGGVLHQEDTIEYRPQLGEGDEADVDYMQAAVGLIWRSLVLWLFLILLATIASVF